MTWGFKGEGDRALELPEGGQITKVAPPGRARIRVNTSVDPVQLEASVDGGEYFLLGDDFGSRIVIVRDESDFPAAVGGVRQLDDSTLYYVQAVIDIGNSYLRTGTGTSIVGISPGPCAIVNTHASFLVRGTGGIRNLQLICPNGVAWTPDNGGTAFLGNVVVTGSQQVANVVSCSRLVIDRLFGGGNGLGIVITGSVPSGQILQMQEGIGAPANFVAIKIEATATIGALVIAENQWQLDGATVVALEFDPAATYSSAAVRVANNNIVLSGGATALVGVDKKNPQFVFEGNSEILDSASLGSISFDNNMSENTIITAQDVFVNIGNGNLAHPPFTLSLDSERFDLVGVVPDQMIRHLGLKGITAVAVYSVTSERIGSGIDEHRFQLVQDGVPLPDSEGSSEANNQAVSTTRAVPLTLGPNSELRIQVANGTDTDNIRVRSARLTVFRVSS